MTVDGSGPVTPGDPTPEAAEPTPPSLTPTGDDRVAVLAAYLRSNAGRYTGEALARAATAAGYSDAEVTAAQAIADSTWQGATHGIRPKLHLGLITGSAIAYVALLYLAIATTGSIGGDVPGAVAIGGLLLGVVAWVVLRDDHPSLALGISCGVIVAIVLPIVLVLAIVGICIATGTNPIGP